MNDKLLPCPFCGSNNVKVQLLELAANWERYYVECFDCYAGGPQDRGESGAIEGWNTRQSQQQSIEVTQNMGDVNGNVTGLRIGAK